MNYDYTKEINQDYESIEEKKALIKKWEQDEPSELGERIIHELKEEIKYLETLKQN